MVFHIFAHLWQRDNLVSATWMEWMDGWMEGWKGRELASVSKIDRSCTSSSSTKKSRLSHIIARETIQAVVIVQITSCLDIFVGSHRLFKYIMCNILSKSHAIVNCENKDMRSSSLSITCQQFDVYTVLNCHATNGRIKIYYGNTQVCYTKYFHGQIQQTVLIQQQLLSYIQQSTGL